MDLVVVSFDQAAVDAFHAAAPRGFPVAPGGGGAWRATSSVAGHRAEVKSFQVPLQFTIGGTTLDVATPKLVSRAHADGYAVHVWLDESEEDEATYARVLDMCADALMGGLPGRPSCACAARRVGKGGRDDCGEPAPACTLRPTAIERRGRVVRVAA